MSEITQPEANAFKAKSIARGKLLERFRCHVQEVVEHAEDEGDRVYFGTSNHFEYLKEIADEMDMWGWDAVIRERDEVDPYADLRKVRDENRALTEERDRLREENERLRIDEDRYRTFIRDVQMLAYKWQEAHDCLKSGLPYSFPSPSDLPECEAENGRMRVALKTTAVWLRSGDYDTRGGLAEMHRIASICESAALSPPTAEGREP